MAFRAEGGGGLKSFVHFDVESIEEAIAAARDGEGSACWMAGGTDLLGVLKDQILPDYPERVVNLKTIPGLDRIEPDHEGVRLGALTKLSVLARDPHLQERFPALAEAARSVATPEIRNMATLGGNLCQDNRCWYYRYPHHMGGRMICKRKGSGPCFAVRGDNRYHVVAGGKGCFAPCPSDTATALAALGAVLEISGPDGSRTLSIHDLYTPMGHVLGAEDILTVVRVPAPVAGSRQAYRKFTVRKPVDFAVVSVAAVVSIEERVCHGASIVLGGVAPAPLRVEESEQAITGRSLAPEAIDRAAELALAECRPLSMNGYKVDIARSLVREVLASFSR